ncbi:PTS sugar transporter subunit IIC [Calorimonas adulescens]|uniref:Permease IIC component n=1 Tax=Calorimonas adulescens TaxID=2606906 RepID=A0A5D8QA06_9THEO|nr:PTS transporter subunit EIIC [Calorimonas adulescens]TZE81341.1 PTS sugar transporter subunit IIC [Calorimonas adulescens]
MNKINKIQGDLQKFAYNIQHNRYISAISNGLTAILPIIMIGAISSLLNSMNVAPYQDFLKSTGIKQYLSIPGSVTTDFIALYAVVAIAYKLAESFDIEGFTPGILALMSFLILTPLGNTKEIGNYLPTNWTGATGLFVAILVGLCVTRLYVYIVNKGWTIKMPDGVPETVTKSFVALLPGFVIAFIMLILRVIFAYTPFGNVHSFIFKIVQLPLQNIGSTWAAMVIGILAIQLLWFFGIHGTLAIGVSIIKPIWLALDLQNLQLFQAGMRGTNIVGWSFYMAFINLGGAGAMLGLAFVLLRAKSKRYRTLGKLALAPALCCINEPLIFGLPVVMNPTFFIPFLVAPVVIGLLAYFLISIGILPTVTGITVPLGTPVILSGFIVGGWRSALYQVVATIISGLIYWPFFRIVDNQAYEEEKLATQQK